MMITSIQKLQHRKISTGSRLRKQPFSDIIRKVVETFSATNRNLHIMEEIRMNINEYQELAMTTLNPELSKRDVLINSVMGLCGESGEAIDIVKKWMVQGHELDKEHLAKELGDVAWYLAEAATALDISLEDIFQANIDKLKMRYPDGFETKKSLVRLKGDI